MAAPIDFYFDFSSPYGYLAGELIDDLAARYGREVRWRPILLGITFKLTGNAPLTQQPLKGEYSIRDFQRSARYYKVPFQYPKQFPISSVAASRMFLWLQEQDPAAAKRYARAVYKAYFVDGRDISMAETAAAIAGECGLDSAAALAANSDPRIKDLFKTAVEAATARGVFGSPFIFVDDEPFWGVDRFPQIEAWLSRGPF